MVKLKKNSYIKKCKVCKKLKSISKNRVTCSHKCATKYRLIRYKI